MESISNSVNKKTWGQYNTTSPPPTIFAFAQCHSDLSQNDCSTCFAISRTKLPKCLPSTSAGIYLDGCFLAYDGHDFSGEALHEDHKHVTCGTRAMLAGCYMRYSTKKFFDVQEDELNGNAGLWEVLAVMVAEMVLSVLSLFGFTMAYQRLQKKTAMTNAPVVTSKSQHKNRLNFKYEMLGNDTDFFNASRKLGQGGAGSVFKGTIPDGSNIAVKRLFFNTRQWAQHNTRQYSSDSLASFQTNIKPMKPPHSL
ncbi:hypothetical protein ACLB2K_017449 [Fragaria x ananassa]